MDGEAVGTFEVTLQPIGTAAETVSGLSIDKRFQGDLDGTSVGQMLAFRSATAGSAGYVALELVSARLAGRSGDFTLQHSGTMDRGTPSLSVTVVPDSATAELVGLSGTMDIVVTPGRHDYRFRYTLPD